MNEHIFTELEASEPQHTRRVIAQIDIGFLSYCTVCAHYRSGTLFQVAGAWAEHLDALRRIDEAKV